MSFVDYIWFIVGVPVGLFLLPLLARTWTDSGVVMIVCMLLGGFLGGMLSFAGSVFVRNWIGNSRRRK